MCLTKIVLNYYVCLTTLRFLYGIDLGKYTQEIWLTEMIANAAKARQVCEDGNKVCQRIEGGYESVV